VGSKTFDGVWFAVFADDHLPPHVHGYRGTVVVVVDLLPDGTVVKSTRPKPVKPSNAKRSEVRRILKVAAEHAAALHDLWEQMHGSSK
jgi:hypothetical protein